MEDHFILANRNKKEFVCPCCTGDIVSPYGLTALWISLQANEQRRQVPECLDHGPVGAGRWHGDIVEALDANHDAYRSVLVHYRNVSQEAIEDWMDYKGISIPDRDCPF